MGARAVGTMHSSISWFLEFTDPELEQSCRAFTCSRTYLATDSVVVAVNVLANAAILLQMGAKSGLPLASRAALLLNLLLSVMHVIAMRQAPNIYTRWRSALVAVSRLTRAFLVFMVTSSIGVQPLGWFAMMLKFFLLSPASGSFMYAVGLPLPMRMHLVVQTIITVATLSQVGKLCSSVAAVEQGVPCYLFDLFSSTHKWLNLFDLKLLPHTLPAGSNCCLPVLSAVVVAYGLVFSTVIVYIMETSSRVMYVSTIANLPVHIARALSKALRIVCVVSCAVCLSALPVLWEISILWYKVSESGVPHFGWNRLAVIVTAVGIEGFMQVWLSVILYVVCSLSFAVLRV